MKKPIIILKWSLIGGGIYFILIGVVHILGLKLPGLYIYYNLPSYDFQDKIVSFLAFGWGVFFIHTGRHLPAGIGTVKALLLAGLVAIAGLSYINISTDFSGLSKNATVLFYWIELLFLILYLILLFTLYRRSSR